MAGKLKSIYRCTECGYESAKWYGKCPECGAWNTMSEALQEPAVSMRRGSIGQGIYHQTAPQATPIREISMEEEPRYKTGVSELDRVLGGGIVKGSIILISGEPGIGKSTILTQICAYLGNTLKILYVSGEESSRQIKLRANRLGVEPDNLYILTETDIQRVLEQVRTEKPDLLMIDSIQTMNDTELNSAPGSVTQVRECTNAIMHIAKGMEIPAIMVGHVNKDGAIAGPKVLEHIVDAVLYFEGDRQMSYRILRAVKNRYGSTNEIGVFDMEETGLHQVENPSASMLTGRPTNVSGTCVTCVMEGSRPILAELQALVTSSGFGNPRRMATGFDYNRMNLLLAVLEKRAGYYFSNLDAYLNVVGGLRLDEPACDLAVSMALVSSLKDVPIADDAVIFGEVGLTGEVRSVMHAEQRIREAERMGFHRCILPWYNLKYLSGRQANTTIQLTGVKNVRQAFAALQQE
ncbi:MULTISPECIES: DNA repair protein RadA [Caproicibacterium]|uniref:DNA repair protein RadA n=1 Tax=Caproicibacterium lactatifermentans TaxID=2666138 RepID=A0A859DUK5_9FIRM|nr:DNA repair protein RadA [Caproicibacterium lactatifermentans]ARP50315.1 DNA repair protein RadA [Ruminococcaceae bacterium CPB6]QKN23963.1 DNA repair protein RadA [Caproicibacterium lactatifermentans]QKO30965.1 DNA repair protein RadA [Caproicibacterium lactatifermentans]